MSFRTLVLLLAGALLPLCVSCAGDAGPVTPSVLVISADSLLYEAVFRQLGQIPLQPQQAVAPWYTPR